MSSDDIIYIIRERNKFSGYWCSASHVYSQKEMKRCPRRFRVDTIEAAILAAQEHNTEYGYRFVNLKATKE